MTDCIDNSILGGGVATKKRGNENQVLTEALACAERGWLVIPLHGIKDGACTCGIPECNSQGKHPHIRDWRMKASTEQLVIRQWWDIWPDSNIGIVCYWQGIRLFCVGH